MTTIESLFEAIRQNDLEKVRLLIDENPEIVFSRSGKYNATPLHDSAFNGFIDATELLISKKAEVNALDKDGLTPLHYAAAKGYGNVVELLVANSANINSEAADGRTAFQIAVKNGHKDISEFMRNHESPTLLSPTLAKLKKQRIYGIFLVIGGGIIQGLAIYFSLRNKNQEQAQAYALFFPLLSIFWGISITRRYKSNPPFLYLIISGIIPGFIICAGWEMIFKYKTSQENTRLSVPSVSKRNGFVTIWLILSLVLYTYGAVNYVINIDAITEREKIPSIIGIAYIITFVLNVIFCVMMLLWKKSGFYGFVAVGIGIGILQFGTGLGAASLSVLIQVAILFGILQIKKDGISAWNNLK
jgi:uncharacterized membrane protein YidH (DUF202 family)